MVEAATKTVMRQKKRLRYNQRLLFYRSLCYSPSRRLDDMPKQNPSEKMFADMDIVVARASAVKMRAFHATDWIGSVASAFARFRSVLLVGEDVAPLLHYSNACPCVSA
jgi:hypothetical protein